MASQTIIGVGIIRQADQFLVGTREEGSTLAGYAEFPGGKLEPNETIEECVRRECLEETGLEVVIEELVLRKQHSYQHGDVDLHFFECRPTSEPTPEPLGTFRWLSKEELMSLQFPEANTEVLKLL